MSLQDIQNIVALKSDNDNEAIRINKAETLEDAHNYLTDINIRITNGETVNKYDLSLNVAQDTLTVLVAFNESDTVTFSYSPIGKIIGQCVQNDVAIMQNDIETQGSTL